MSVTLKENPVILVDLAKRRIRIHKRTLHFLGDPEYILLLVNPDEKTLGVIGCEKDEKSSHHIPKNRFKSNSYELYSTSLIYSLREICPDWKDGEKYRIIGELLQNARVARFSMANGLPINSDMEC